MNHAPQKTDQALAAARIALLADFRATFTTEHGTRALAHLRASAGIGRPVFLSPPGGGPIDPLAAAFRDGRHSILHEIQALLDEPEDAAPRTPQPIRPRRRRAAPI
jgi:hypothetical protein